MSINNIITKLQLEKIEFIIFGEERNF